MQTNCQRGRAGLKRAPFLSGLEQQELLIQPTFPLSGQSISTVFFWVSMGCRVKTLQAVAKLRPSEAGRSLTASRLPCLQDAFDSEKCQRDRVQELPAQLQMC